MDPEIKITANIEPSRPNTCRFNVDRPIYNGSFNFPSKEAAQGSPLAEKLFALGDVESALISGNDVTVTRTTYEDWRAAAKKIADTIREHIRSGQPAVSAELKASQISEVDMKNKLQQVFDAQINPAIAAHGGFAELVDVKDNKVYLRMGGGCHGCGQANATLRQGIEVILRRHFPHLGEIVDVTDHASGAHPYYVPSGE